MKYHITISKIEDEKTAKLVARKIGEFNSGISFRELCNIISNTYFDLPRKFSHSEIKELTRFLDSLDVSYQIKEVTVKKKEKITEKPVITNEEKITKDEPKIVHYESKIPTKQNNQKVLITISSLTILTIIVIVILLVISPKKKEYQLPANVNLLRSKTSVNSNKRNLSTFSKSDILYKEKVEEADKGCKDNSSHNPEKLYKIAISFNDKNSDAWFGLLNCYKVIKKVDKYKEVSTEIKDNFGNKALELHEYLKRYGSIEIANKKNYTLSIVYKSNVKDKDHLLEQLFQITRRVNATEEVSELKILAKTSFGTTIFVQIPIGMIVSYNDFIKNAKIEIM